MDLDQDLVTGLVARALQEDLESVGDLTTRLSVGESSDRAQAEIVAKATGVVAGLAFAEASFRARDADAVLRRGEGITDGSRVEPGQVVLTIQARASALLEAERTALNFLQRISGIATQTRTFVDAVAGTDARILDTRKTTPTLRLVEKFAVAAGGGHNHRIGLFDQVLLKENHFAACRARGEDYESVVARVVGSGQAGPLPVVAEARDIDEARAAVRGGAGVVLLDNFAIPDGLTVGVQAVREEAAQAGRTVLVEASGGIDLDTVRAVAACGVDRISIGALTHSAKSLDLSMLVCAEVR